MAQSNVICDRAGGNISPRRDRLFRKMKTLPEAAAREQGLKRSHFRQVRLPVLLLLPQLSVLFLFFFIPSIRTLTQAFQLTDPFGMSVEFVGFENFARLLNDPLYWSAAYNTIVFTLIQNAFTLGTALVFAFATNHIIRGQSAYKTLLLLPYAIAPAVTGVIWAFLFNPAIGPVAYLLHSMGIAWDPNYYPNHAMLLAILAASWKHICYNYIFLVAGLLAIPRSIIEAAAVDGAGPVRRFISIAMPLLTPTFFFLITINFVYGLFETFAIIDTTTAGGPAGSTTTLVYKVYLDGFVALDLGASAAQSLILMVFALMLTYVQFRFIERRVTYAV